MSCTFTSRVVSTKLFILAFFTLGSFKEDFQTVLQLITVSKKANEAKIETKQCDEDSPCTRFLQQGSALQLIRHLPLVSSSGSGVLESE